MYSVKWKESEDQPTGNKRIRLMLTLYKDDKVVFTETRTFDDATDADLKTIAQDKITEFESMDAAYIAERDARETALAALPTRQQIKGKIKDKLNKKIKK